MSLSGYNTYIVLQEQKDPSETSEELTHSGVLNILQKKTVLSDHDLGKSK